MRCRNQEGLEGQSGDVSGVHGENLVSAAVVMVGIVESVVVVVVVVGEIPSLCILLKRKRKPQRTAYSCFLGVKRNGSMAGMECLVFDNNGLSMFGK